MEDKEILADYSSRFITSNIINAFVKKLNMDASDAYFKQPAGHRQLRTHIVTSDLYTWMFENSQYNNNNSQNQGLRKE